MPRCQHNPILFYLNSKICYLDAWFAIIEEGCNHDNNNFSNIHYNDFPVESIIIKADIEYSIEFKIIRMAQPTLLLTNAPVDRDREYYCPEGKEYGGYDNLEK